MRVLSSVLSVVLVAVMACALVVDVQFVQARQKLMAEQQRLEAARERLALLQAARPAPAHQRIHARILKVVQAVEVTHRTVFFWNGQACGYDAIPAEAVPFLIELAPDGKTIVKVTFRKLVR